MAGSVKAAYWRERAEKARSLLAKLSSDESREAMLRVAESYDRLAENAERRKKPKNSN